MTTPRRRTPVRLVRRGHATSERRLRAATHAALEDGLNGGDISRIVLDAMGMLHLVTGRRRRKEHR